MRQIVLDTETTGLDASLGHRVIEIGCVELVNRRVSGNHFHTYLNPEREVEQGAIAVHGLDNKLLDDQPLFAEMHARFEAFIAGAELIIHNAPFDLAFLDMEIARIDAAAPGLAERHLIHDTLVSARELFPGQRNSLDALCKRYYIDNSQRTLHGALLDAEILAEVYLAMTGGQTALALDADQAAAEGGADSEVVRRGAGPLKVILPTAGELAAHEATLDAMEKDGKCLWRHVGEATA